MNIYLLIVLFILVFQYLLDFVVEYLNMKHVSLDLPKEFEGYYDNEKYKKSQQYLKTNTGFKLVEDTFFLVVVIAFIVSGGFNYVDLQSRSFGYGYIITGLIFSAVIIFALQLLKLPFSYYGTFVIEEKFGFNKTTFKTFVLDIVKSWALTILIGAPVLAVILWFFDRMGGLAWFYCWTAVTLFQIFLLFVAPVVIMPLFNKFIPLEEGELKSSIENYAKAQDFKMKGLFKMDGSKRSTKSNAFFTGFGRFRRIVLFDTLIARHTVDELVSVLAHEMGHYKKKHILKFILSSIFTTGVMFYVMSLVITRPWLFQAFGMEDMSIYAGLFFFGLLYTPLNMIFSTINAIFSRKYEYEADRYAVETYGKPEAMIDALKKLSVDNLSNLTPHPLKVFLEYSHPPVLDRIKAIRYKQ
jgi:STE24 endopeptidase